MVGIKLEDDEVMFLRDFVKKGRKSARELTKHAFCYWRTSKKGILR